MNQQEPTTSAPGQNSGAPSLKALEAAAIRQLLGMLKNDQGKMPSEESILIAARLMARKAHREIMERDKSKS